MQPENFILVSDYATLKNDKTGISVSITLPASASVPSLGVYETHIDVNGGTIGAGIRSRIRSSKFGNRWMSVPQLLVTRAGTIGGNPAFYTVIAYVYPVSAGVIRCSIMAINDTSGALTGEVGDEVFEFYIATFLPPFA